MDGSTEASTDDLLTARVARLEQELATQSSALAALTETITGLRNELNIRSAPDFARPRKPFPPAVDPRISPAVVQGFAAPGLQPEAAQQSASLPAPVMPDSPPSVPLFTAVADSKPQPKRSLENRIGGQFFNRIGIVAILTGVAVFLKLAIDSHWIHPSPAGKVITGLLLGTGVVLWSERFRRKGYPAFSYSLKAVGSGTLYLALWASFHIYHLVPAPVALLLMVGVTAWNATMAWVQDAELLAAYALVGGFATPALLGPGDGHFTFLFSYLFAMDAAVLFLIAKKPWQRLILGSFPATVMYFIGWYSAWWDPTQSLPVGFFIVLLAAPMVLTALVGKQRESLLEGVIAPVGAGAFLSLGLYSVLQDSGRHGWLPWLAVLLAALYLLLTRVRRNGVAEAVHLALAITFLTVAIPLKASGRWITIGWLAEGTALIWVAARALGPQTQKRVRSVIRWMACAALALGVAESLIFWAGQDAHSAFWNGRFFTELAAVAAVALTAWLARHAANTPEPIASDVTVQAAKPSRSFTPAWVTIALVAIPVTHILAALAVARELVAYWNVGPAETSGLRDQLSQLSVSALLLVYGAALLTWTIRRIPADTTRRTHPAVAGNSV